MKQRRRDMEQEAEKGEAKSEGKEETQKERSQHRFKFLEVVQGGEQTSYERMMKREKTEKKELEERRK